LANSRCPREESSRERGKLFSKVSIFLKKFQVPGDSETKKEDPTKWNLRCLTVGGEHNLAVTKKGNVYSWGFNHCGQLGIRSRDSETRPVHVRELKNISRAYCGDSYCFAISDEDHVMYAWGYNNFGQLGLGDR
jgi:alpha-tubulin suppressor-like RCC1 family protein